MPYYRCLHLSRIADIQKELDKWGRKGYRLYMFQMSGSRPILIMEKITDLEAKYGKEPALHEVEVPEPIEEGPIEIEIEE